jgi:uncharacterized membrane protein YozB (DUF420 family)
MKFYKIPCKWLSLIFLFLSVIPIYMLSTMSKGNFLAGPVSIIISIPLIILKGLIAWSIWKNPIKYNKNLMLTGVSLVILFFELCLLYKYITNIT